MAKYSNDFKLKVVQFYISNNFGYKKTANYFNIPSYSIVRKWVRKYNEHGISGLSRNQIKYDGFF